MAYLWIAYILGGLFLLYDDYEYWRQHDYERFKEHWRQDHCSQGEHFVGVRPPYPHCEICGKVPRKIFHAPNGKVEGWEW